MDPVSPRPSESTQPVTPEAFDTLVRQHKRLEKLFIVALAGMILVVFSVNVYFSREAKLAKAQADQVQSALNQLKKIDPVIHEFVTSMQQYAAMDKDFLPIWEKYRPALSNFTIAPRAPAPSGAAPARPAQK